ncbi:hypothetical protein F5B19DRAFT_496658 [Rostrohypoxylon terebratum]|nr:hypothetical protein F5B19DRAFT_496658 [Rostrohypoxylon terebratum]
MQMLQTLKPAILLFIGMLATTLALAMPRTVSHQVLNRENGNIVRDEVAVFINNAPILKESEE